jgi:hypothetical protein
MSRDCMLIGTGMCIGWCADALHDGNMHLAFAMGMCAAIGLLGQWIPAKERTR